MAHLAASSVGAKSPASIGRIVRISAASRLMRPNRKYEMENDMKMIALALLA
jgi:hypothetical protein